MERRRLSFDWLLTRMLWTLPTRSVSYKRDLLRITSLVIGSALSIHTLVPLYDVTSSSLSLFFIGYDCLANIKHCLSRDPCHRAVKSLDSAGLLPLVSRGRHWICELFLSFVNVYSIKPSPSSSSRVGRDQKMRRRRERKGARSSTSFLDESEQPVVCVIENRPE